MIKSKSRLRINLAAFFFSPPQQIRTVTQCFRDIFATITTEENSFNTST